jgi:hypothetical protein
VSRDRSQLAAALAPPAPPCFGARDTWLEYVASAAEAQKDEHAPGPLVLKPGEPVHFNPAFDFCADCTVQHRARMNAAGRCEPQWLQVFAAGEGVVA